LCGIKICMAYRFLLTDRWLVLGGLSAVRAVKMPAKFDRCVQSGGRVRTIKPKGMRSSTYLKTCYPRGGGPAIAGHVQHRKKKLTSRK